MNAKPLKHPLNCVCRLIWPVCFGLAMFSWVAPARAQIALVDNETNNSPFTTTLLLATNLTVSPSANTLVVEVVWRNLVSATEAPSTLNWTNATTTNTLTLAVQLASTSPKGRASAIYYCYNPTAGAGYNISGAVGSGSAGLLLAYTLSGVDTTVVSPLTDSVSVTGSGATSISFTMNGIANNSWAAVAGAVATAINSTITVTNSGVASGTPALTTTNNDSGDFATHPTSTAMGYISTIAGGSDLFTYQYAAPNSSDASFSAVIFAPRTGSPTIHITAASASPNPVVVGSPVLFSVTAASTAGSITSVVVNASAIGGSSALPLNLSAGNVYTNSVTTTISIANANLPVTVQDSANNVLTGSIPVSVEPPSPGIVLQDGSTAITEANGSTVSRSLTVTVGANVLVLLVEDKGASAVNSEPATLAWGSQTILQAVAQDNPAATLRGESIYYLFNPTPGTNNITVTVANSPANVEMTAYTLSGVDTNVAPLTGSGGDSTAGIMFNVPGVPAGSCAAFNATWASTNPIPTITGTGGTTAMTSFLVADTQFTVMSAGYISGLSAGTDTFAASWAAAGEKNNFAVAVFTPIIHITAASASPNPVVVGSPVLFSVTAASTAGSITSVVVNASAIGGSSALPLNLSAGNVYTNSVTTTMLVANASLPVTVQDSAGNFLMSSIPLSMEPTIRITAASASPNPVVVGSPVSLSVTAASTAGSISSVVVNASAIGGSSALPLDLSAGNIYTNSVTTTIPVANASLQVTIQDSANYVLTGSIPVSVETTNMVESELLRLVVYPVPFSFMVIDKATGTVLLQQTTNQFTIGSIYDVSQATNIVITATTLDADLVLAGTSATGHITFNLIQPGIIQTTLSSSNNSPSQIFQQFADQGEDIFGALELPVNATLGNRGNSLQLIGGQSVAGIDQFSGAHAPFYVTTRHYGIYVESQADGTMTFAQSGYTSFSFPLSRLTYDIIYGTNYATIMAGFNSRTVPSYMPPTWAFDSSWWMQDAHSLDRQAPASVTNAQSQIMDVANKLQLYQIHAASQFLNRPYGTACSGTNEPGNGDWGNMTFDTSAAGFPNPAQMISQLHADGLNLMVWIL